MSVDLQIYERRERAMVRLADAALTPLGWRRPPQPQGPVRRVLLMRLERIGDLLMVVDAIQDARAAWPDAELDLAIGSWNAELAELLPGITRLEILDAPWLARERAGDPWPRLVRKARAWRRLEYDLAVNFEPDIRSNFLAWLSGAPARFGYSSAGGGRFLTHAEPYEPSRHVSDNARRLIARAAGRDPASPGTPRRSPALALPDAARRLGSAVLAGAARPIVAVHASGGRESKQWHVDRFAGVAQAVVAREGGTIVLTGTRADRPLVDAVRRGLGRTPVIDASGDAGLPVLAALLAGVDLFITGDTGPMHLAAVMGTPVVAVFGPSQPARYGPVGTAHRIVRVDLPCSPCGQVRLPPVRCRGHVPECLDRIEVKTVVDAAIDLLHDARPGRVPALA